MIKNYLKTALRSFMRHKGYSLLNITGLALGMAASILILQYVKYEKSYDRFHKNAEDIYRVQYNNYQNNKLTFECAAAVPAVGPALKENFPEVKEFARMLPLGGVITYQDPVRGEIAFKEPKLQCTDQAVFKVFDLNLLKGDPETCLDGPGKIAISESAAKKYFGDDEPMGKTLKWNGQREFEVAGVFTDLPDNSHIKFDFLLSNTMIAAWWDWESWQESWGWYDHNTYVLLEPGTDVDILQSKWDQYVYEDQGESWEQRSYRQEFILQPMTEIHLYAKLLQESEPEELGDANSVYFLTIIAFFILIIAWVNYINLSTAKSMERANEVGVRKVMGAYRRQLTFQFLTESVLINLTALLIAIILVLIAWPSFAAISGRNIPFSMINDVDFWLIATGLFVFGAFIAGFYPSIILASYKPISVLKGKINKSASGDIVRKSLVVFQFMASVILIVGTLIVYQQIDFMKKKDLGIGIVETIVLEGPGVTDSLYADNLEGFKNEVSRITGVTSVTASSNVPGHEIIWTRGIKRLTGGPESQLTIYNVGIDYDYIPAFDLEVLAGRNFSEEYPGDEGRIILNRALAEAIEFEDLESAIGEKVNLGGDTLEIVGVIEDYHQMSLKMNTAPMVFRKIDASTFYAIKVDSDRYQTILGAVNDQWNTFFPGNPFNYFFLDQYFNRQYKSDQQFGQVFAIFSILAIFVACLGLFGLASFMTSQRTKEIGIRKALGSSIQGIVQLLSSGFIKLVGISIILAWPVSWILMDQWLNSFPYRIDINPFILISAGGLVILIAFLSVSFKTIKAAQVNPANTLRYE